MIAQRLVTSRSIPTLPYIARWLGGRLLDPRDCSGQVFRIVDLEGNQAVDTLFYNAHDTSERYSARTPFAGSATFT